jgi:2-polyprenyl-3-methyl-5-hydroxy-6-metoxy-1,4-benzoquinol methylase
MVNDAGRGFNQLAADQAIDLLGPCTGLTILDVGCGEGSVARRVATAGAAVWAADPTQELLAAAVQHERLHPLGVRYFDDHAEDLRSVATGSVDAVLAVLVLHHVEHVDLAWSEAHRVLRPGGSIVVVIPHPWTDHDDASWSTEPDSSARRQLGAYTREGYWRTDETDSIRAVGWYHRTLATWLTTCATAGFTIGTVREPTGAESRRQDQGGRWSNTPRFLAWRAHCDR